MASLNQTKILLQQLAEELLKSVSAQTPQYAPAKKVIPHGKRDEPVIGFRCFNVKYRQGIPFLHSMAYSESSWVAKKPTKAHCGGYPKEANYGEQNDHSAPDEFCGCGLYAFSSIEKAIEYHDSCYGSFNVIGAILAWGRVIQHGDEGFRAQFGQPIGILRSYQTRTFPSRVEEETYMNLFEDVSNRYEIPIFNDAHWMEVAVKEYGSTLPNED